VGVLGKPDLAFAVDDDARAGLGSRTHSAFHSSSGDLLKSPLWPIAQLADLHSRPAPGSVPVAENLSPEMAARPPLRQTS